MADTPATPEQVEKITRKSKPELFSREQRTRRPQDVKPKACAEATLDPELPSSRPKLSCGRTPEPDDG